MKYGLSIALALLWFAFSTSYAQTHLTDWKNLNSKSTITCITHNTDYLYASTMGGGIVQINKRTGEQHCIDHAQDGLPDNYVLSVTLHNNELWTTNRFYGISQRANNRWFSHTLPILASAQTNGFIALPSTATLHA